MKDQNNKIADATARPKSANTITHDLEIKLSIKR